MQRVSCFMLNNLALRLYSGIAVIVLKTMLSLQNSTAFHYDSVYWLMKSLSKPSYSMDIEEPNLGKFILHQKF